MRKFLSTTAVAAILAESAGREVIARLRADAAVTAGQRTQLAFNLDKAVFFDIHNQQRIA